MSPGDCAHVTELNAEPRLGRLSLASWRAAWWARRAVRRARNDLKVNGLAARIQSPPRLPWGARVGVNAVLNRLEPTCLEKALVLQAWLAAHDVRRDVVLGVRNNAGKVDAHAWIDDVACPDEYAGYTVIHRIPPSA